MIAGLCVLFQRNVVFAQITNYVHFTPSIVRCLYFEGAPPADFPLMLYAPAEARKYLWVTPLIILQHLLLPVLVVAIPGMLLIRPRKPRPPWQDLFRQPGFVACLSIVAVYLIEIDLSWMGIEIPRLLSSPGVIVALSWTVLLVTRRWRNERGWIDRLGRGAGIGWILVTVFGLIMNTL